MPTNAPTIAQQVVTLQEGMAAQAPADLLRTFSDEQPDLEASGIPGGVATVGTPMPDGELLDVHGRSTTLARARNGRPAVVVFYRGAWCPYCNVALRTYQQQLLPALSEQGVALISISPQKPDGSLTMQETNELTYTVVSDPGNQIAGKLGILTAPSDEAGQAQAALGLDVAAGNADATNTVPMPTVVVVDGAGAITWVDVHPNYATRTEVTDILHAVAAAG